jgi:hypothetical protein
MRSMKIGLTAIVLLSSSFASAQESEFQHKMQEDLDYYKPQLVNNCGVTDKIEIKYVGKLGSNPRESKGDGWAPSMLCGMGLDAVVYSCQTSEPVKKVMSHLTNVVCTAGSGPISYKLRGGDLTLVVDASYRNTKSSASPKDELVAKLKKDLDR